MARPKREGLDYFPLDITAGVGDEVELLEAEYGLPGFAIYIKLLQAIYKAGYFISWTEKEQLLFSKRVSCSREETARIIASSLEWGLFDKRLYERYAILTSHGIQQRYLLAIGRRSGVEIQEEYLLLNEKELSETKAGVKIIPSSETEDKTPISAAETAINAAIMPQREKEREKESERKKKEERKGKRETPPLRLSTFQKLTVCYEKAYGPLPQKVKKQLQHLISEGMEEEMIRYAITIAAHRNKSSPFYALGICSSLLSNGICTKEEYERRDAYDTHSGCAGQAADGLTRTEAEYAQLNYKPQPGEVEEKLPF